MISLDLAIRLRAVTDAWTPATGDRFMIPDRDLDDAMFTLSDMVVEVVPGYGDLLGFNGTTEWALDSIEQREVVWLPREDQLRVMLGAAFVAMSATPGGFVVTIERDGHQERHIDIDAECAYARAVLALRPS